MSCLVEGAVANEDNLRDDPQGPRADQGAGLLRRLRRDRQRDGPAQPAGRGPGSAAAGRTWSTATSTPAIPDDRGIVPVLLDRVPPVHAVVPVDFYLPGCPPPADRIRAVLEQLLAGEAAAPGRREIKFG